MKDYLKKHPIFPHSILLFIATITMIGFSAEGIRNFLVNVLKLGTVSFLLTFILYIFAGVGEKNSKCNIPIMFFWATIYLALTIGNF